MRVLWGGFLRPQVDERFEAMEHHASGASASRLGEDDSFQQRGSIDTNSRPNSMDEHDGLLRHNSIELLSSTEQQVVRIEKVSE